MKVFNFHPYQEANGRTKHRLTIMVDDKLEYDVTDIPNWPCFENGVWVMKILSMEYCELLKVKT